MRLNYGEGRAPASVCAQVRRNCRNLPQAGRPSPSATVRLRRFTYGARRHTPGREFSTVTARRFCDQHEMSLQVATGRSLP